MADDGLSEKDIKQIKKELGEIKRYIKAIEDMGGEVPKDLKKSLNRLETAINTAKDIGDAASDAAKTLRANEKAMQQACKTVGKEHRFACEAGEWRKWFNKGTIILLDPKQKDGFYENFIKRTLKRYTPDKICQHFEYCAKIEKKAK
ncbi:MAG: hypothetical protein WD046_03875 [Paracoccaceae bacterium]